MINAPEWIIKTLENPEITDFVINGAHEAFIDRGAGLEELLNSSSSWNDTDLRNWVLDLLSIAGKTWDAKHPFIDAVLPSGHRLHVVFPPTAKKGILVSLRRLNSTDQGVKRWQNSPVYQKLIEIIQRGESLLISGATGSGKTTLASDLLSEVSPLERILALEDTPELNPKHPHFITLLSRPPNADGCGEITLRTLLKQALRMRPDRIVLGECRSVEVLELLQALNTGHKGALATLHANSPREAIKRVELLCLLGSGGSLPLQAIRDLVSFGVQWIVQVKRHGSQREITELSRIEGREGEVIILRPIYDKERAGSSLA